MVTVTFTEFRKHASQYFDRVENGEVLLILRHGRAIAEISPSDQDDIKIPLWKKPGLRLSIKGKSLSHTILEERETLR
ncbi:type II toxin-antitoxin system Phd/YefM family antitoxin [candidate division KSB1 bacterium]|nr:type II toxin-antitoxin system Phd/YefM family antitoxin [candidate division KSB1 bacterium]